MGYELLVILIVASLLILLCVYRIFQITNKINRLKTRYDKLLRGRGEFNLEELLGSQAEDIEYTLDRLEKIEKTNQVINKDLNINKSIFLSEMEKSLGSIDGKLSSEIYKVDSRLAERLEKAERSINNLSKISEEKIDKYQDHIIKELHENVREMKKEYNQLFTKLNDSTNSKIESLVKENAEFRENLAKNTNETVKKIGDKLAFAVQKMAIHRYDAFENQSGELSFTIVLLDQFNNGIMFSCINGRDSSYTYSKEINNGKSDYDFSPEEQIALNKVIN